MNPGIQTLAITQGFRLECLNVVVVVYAHVLTTCIAMHPVFAVWHMLNNLVRTMQLKCTSWL